ncbi:MULTISPECIES: RhuM family protein [unclassified Halorhodospira]|uniref:RhuM family protein n=1 Tax=unclassified Halorhodospira TaxID=2626748 RepID=UPI001EE92FF4|nr:MULTISPECIES: RhuM family protein [unclassified Halorhodospira]MCG5541882.1 virulence RhuM family protein [Halorhodospira sp. M39old]MCG5546945.1 virulence RhuM family protein [Halorhodospira sp. M38]
MQSGEEEGEIAIYETDSGAFEVRVEAETVWLTQAQMSELFQRDQSVISRHISSVFREGELEEATNMQKMHIASSDKPVTEFSLDVIISVGYRVKSQQGVRFRQWANRVLKEHLTCGYTINRQRFEENARELEAALQLVRKAATAPALDAQSGQGLVEILSHYTRTFLWLQRYDEGLLQAPPGQAGGDLPTATEAMAALEGLKAELMERAEATELFARPRDDGLASILGNLDQTVFGEPAYPSIEAKAAHLLYFVVKDHPFADGNKRSGAFLFVDFLHRNGRLLNDAGQPVVNDAGLAALTLLVAESAADQKGAIQICVGDGFIRSGGGSTRCCAIG